MLATIDAAPPVDGGTPAGRAAACADDGGGTATSR